ncbi:MAG: replication-associated recombination protein A [Clostridiales bacterium]|jgi:putative ATPase|nr:replication-associated recombination protein A [Clostridiales bacterium]
MSQISIFEQENNNNKPLPERMRPRTLDEFVGQAHLLGEGKVLRRIVEEDRVNSLILWGPPGVGKTTLAKVIANMTKAQFITFSAVTTGIKEIKTVMQQAEKVGAYGDRTIVFIDEIHRFNKAQQDAFLPFVEKGSITLIGATTENPSFEINSALLSRCKVFVMHQLTEEDLVVLIKRAISDERGLGDMQVGITEEQVRIIARFANGDARTALSTLEMIVLNGEYGDDKNHVTISNEIIEQCISKKSLLYDKNGEEHYNLISALHKSMRNSDPDASVYWLARMLEAGEDPLYVARRVTRFASEDVGLADPRGLEIAVAAFQACHYIGMPECSVPLTQAVIYLALAPKSNSMETAYLSARKVANAELAEPVPMNIRNAPTELMKGLGYNKGYVYAHDTQDKVSSMQCLPDNLVGTQFYKPTEQGLEGRFKDRYEAILKWKEENK